MKFTVIQAEMCGASHTRVSDRARHARASPLNYLLMYTPGVHVMENGWVELCKSAKNHEVRAVIVMELWRCPCGAA